MRSNAHFCLLLYLLILFPHLIRGLEGVREFFVGIATLQTGGHEAHEHGMGLERTRGQAGVGLGADEEGVAGQFQDLHDGLVRGLAREDETFLFQGFDVAGIDFVAVTETHTHGFDLAQELEGEGVGLDLDVTAAQSHVTAQALDLLLFGQDVDHGLLALGFDLGAVRLLEAADVAGEFEHGHLEAQAQAQVGQVVFAGIADGGDLAFRAACAETARHDDAVHVPQLGCGVLVGDLGGLDPVDLDVTTQGDARVFQGVDDGGVAVAYGGVLAGDADGDGFIRDADTVGEVTPTAPGLAFVTQVDAVLDLEQTQNLEVHAVFPQHGRNRVDAVRVVHADDAFDRDIAEDADLLSGLFVDRIGGAAGDDVRLDADLHQLFDAELGGLGLLLAQGLGFEDVGQGHEATAVLIFFVGQFPHGFEVVGVFQVTDRAADFHEDHVRLGLHGQGTQLELDLAGDMRDHLHVATQVVAVTFLVQYGGKDLAAGGEVGATEVLIEHTLVGAQVHITFHAVVQHEDLAVAEGVERAGVHVEVAFQFDGGDLEALVLQELGQAGGEDTLAQAAHDCAHDKDVFGLALLVALGNGGEKFTVRGNVAD